MLVPEQNGYTEVGRSKQQNERAAGRGRVMFDDFVPRLERITPITKRKANEVRCACPEHGSDNPTSLSVRRRTNGGIIVKCFTKGCAYEDIVKRVMEDDTPHNYTPDKKYKKGRGRDENWIPYWERQIESIHPYHDKNGVLLYQKIRFSKKDYPHDAYAVRRPHTEPDKAARGYWHWSLGDTRRVLYNFPDVLEAKIVIVCEGEKDADNVNDALRELGLYGEFVATTTHDGANGKWHKSYTDDLFLKDVIILPDNDAPGLEHAEKVAKALTHFIVRTVKIVHLTDFVPNLSIGGDASDFLEAGHSVLAVLALADTIRPYHAPTPANTTTTDERKVTRSAEKCDCSECRSKAKSVITMWEGQTNIRRETKCGTVHSCKRKLHERVYRLSMQVLEEQSRPDITDPEQMTPTTEMYARRWEAADYVKWRNRNLKRKHQHRYRYLSIKQANGTVITLSNDASVGDYRNLLPTNPDELYDMLNIFVMDKDENTKIKGTGEFGMNYQGSRGNGRKKSKIRKMGEDAVDKCVQFTSKMGVSEIGRAIKKKVFNGAIAIKAYCLDVYNLFVGAGIDMKLRKSRDGVTTALWDVAGITPDNSDLTIISSTDKDMIIKSENTPTDTPIIDTTDDEINQLIPLPIQIEVDGMGGD